MSSAGQALAAALGCLTLAGCANGEATLDPDREKPCANRGTPVSLSMLVRTFRDNGVSLEINERRCALDDEAQATNLGSTGLKIDDEIARVEGNVLCGVDFKTVGRKIRVVKYAGDEETYVDALNVNCSIYPSDRASEETQVRQLREAFEALVASVP